MITSVGAPTDFNVVMEAARMHVANERWWHDLETGERLKLDPGERCMLVVTELAECAEGVRKDLMDDKLPQYKMEHVEIVDALIRMLDLRWGYGYTEPFRIFAVSLGDEYTNTLAMLGRIAFEVGLLSKSMQDNPEDRSIHVTLIDSIITMLFNYATIRGFVSGLLFVYEAKVAYNATRYDHSREGRLAAHGKKI